MSTRVDRTHKIIRLHFYDKRPHKCHNFTMINYKKNIILLFIIFRILRYCAGLIFSRFINFYIGVLVGRRNQKICVYGIFIDPRDEVRDLVTWLAP